MIESDRESSFETRKVHMDNLYRVVQYCENITDCRRAQLLHYFGETDYDVNDCMKHEITTCDNCRSKTHITVKDFSQIAKVIVKSVSNISHRGTWDYKMPLRKPSNRLTVNQYIDILMVSSSSSCISELRSKLIITISFTLQIYF